MRDEKESQKEWYSNQQLYEIMVALSKRLEEAVLEMEKTRIIIRDYNGLRERLGTCEQQVVQILAAGTGRKDMWGYVVGGIGVLLALISYTTR